MSKINIEDVEKVVSQLACATISTIEENKRNDLEQELNAMFGQWFEVD